MLKIENLVFTTKALKIVALLGFIVGLPAGFLVAYIQDTGNSIPPFWVVFFLMAYNLSVFFILSKKISKNIIELK